EDITVELTDNCDFTLEDYRSLVQATDNCSDVTITQLPAPGTVITENQEVVMVVGDDYGNESVCTFNVIIEDTIDPVITCGDNLVQTNDLGDCGAVVTYDFPTATDNCTVESIVLIEGLDSGEQFPVGITTVTYEATDGFGNTAQCSFTVEVLDEELPTIVCPENIAVNNDLGICGAVVEYELPITTDNCAVAELNLIGGLASGEVFPVGTTDVTYEVIDLYGNQTECTFAVTVSDNEAPVITACTEDVVVENDEGACGAVVVYNLPEATDNCEVTEVLLLAGLDSGEFFEEGTTLITYGFVDAAGNQSICTFNVTVNDTEAPSIICQNDVTVENDFGICGAVVEYNEPLVDDNCAVDSLTLIAGPISGSTFDVGTTTITYEVVDASGNTSTCSFDIIVEDTEDPTIACPEDINQEDAYIEYALPIFTDNCGATIELVEGLESGSVFPHGITEVVYMVTDAAGNSVECSFEVLINTPPVGEDDEADFAEEDEEIIIDVLDNDYDIDGDDIHISDANADNGEATIVDGEITYSPFTGYCGTDTITYIVCDTYNACDTAIVVVQIECFIDIIIPEGYSPNGDGTNDTFEILGLEDYPGNRLTVYNRWGHKVFEADNYQSDWEGRSQSALTLGGEYLPEGTYFYVLELGNVAIKPIKGYVYLNH
ncbi:MAG: HYR domain-containing protein, partial [Flavobacteriales bacterium]